MAKNSIPPHVLTTRLGLLPGATVELDDVWFDNHVSGGNFRAKAPLEAILTSIHCEQREYKAPLDADSFSFERGTAKLLEGWNLTSFTPPEP